MAKIEKARYWVGVLYPENMREGWQEDIGDIVQVPYCYCVHDLDHDQQSEHRKDHVHLILVFSNTTTYKHAMSIFNLLSASGKSALNKIEAIVNIRNMYDYLIHNTDTCKKKGKHLYSPSCRISGNCFDIGSYEQLSVSDRDQILKELCDVIRDNRYIFFGDFYFDVISGCEDSRYFEIFRLYSSIFERLIRSNYLKYGDKNNMSN